MLDAQPSAASSAMRQLVSNLERATSTARQIHGWDAGAEQQCDARDALVREIARLEARCARLQTYARTTIDVDRMSWQSDRDVLHGHRLRDGDV